MAVSDFSGLTISNPQVGIQITKVTDSSADWASVANSTYFYDKTDNLVHYKNSSGTVLEIFSANGGGSWTVTTQTGASYTASNNNYVLINAATHILTLPAASANARVGVKMINATVTSIQVRTASVGVTIDGVDRSSVGLGIFNQYDAFVFVSDGTNWFIES